MHDVGGWAHVFSGGDHSDSASTATDTEGAGLPTGQGEQPRECLSINFFTIKLCLNINDFIF